MPHSSDLELKTLTRKLKCKLSGLITHWCLHTPTNEAFSPKSAKLIRLQNGKTGVYTCIVILYRLRKLLTKPSLQEFQEAHIALLSNKVIKNMSKQINASNTNTILMVTFWCDMKRKNCWQHIKEWLSKNVLPTGSKSLCLLVWHELFQIKTISKFV